MIDNWTMWFFNSMWNYFKNVKCKCELIQDDWLHETCKSWNDWSQYSHHFIHEKWLWQWFFLDCF